MKKYEIMYIINPTILEEGRDAVVEKVNGILTCLLYTSDAADE